MKWLQKKADPVPAEIVDAPIETVDDVEHTEKWAVPDEIEGEATLPPVAQPAARSPSGRRLARTVASPIPAMLAESMGLAEEPAAPSDPAAVTPSSANSRGR